MKITEMLDPIPIDEGPVTKFGHHLKEGQRVRVKETGHRGKVSNLGANNRVHVELDSGHFIHCAPSELEPEDFPSARAYSPEVSRVQKALDPLPFDDDPVVKSEKIFSHAARESFRPLLKSVAGIIRAWEAGTVSVRDRVLIKMAFENIEAGRTVRHPLDLLGETEEHNAKILRIMAEKYAGTPASDRLEKRARTGLRVGMKVRGIHAGELGKVGTIRAIDGPLVRVTFDDGTGESTTVLNSTMETLIPVEG